ncbi:hypothetical protein BH23ACT5_BH23ACT5_10590 [soil metagenome]
MEPLVGSASVLVRTLNEGDFLAATLETVLGQTVTPHEVFVIDSGSTDRTLSIARSYPVRIIEIPPREWSYPRALNVGARQATGEYIVCLSAHSVPADETWLASLLAPLEDPAVAAVWGQDLNPSELHPVPGPPQAMAAGSYTVETRSWGLSNANSALRRELWAAHPFDEQMPAAEDKSWARDMMDRGWTVVYQPSAITHHERHSARRAFRRNQAVMGGYRMMFPELARPAGGSVRHVLNQTRRVAAERIRDPRPSQIWRDVKQGVTAVAHLVGGYRTHRRP